MTARYSFGGDEHIFVEVSEEMSLDAFFKSLFLCRALKESAHRGRDRDLSGQRVASGQVQPRRHRAGRPPGRDQVARGRVGNGRADAADAHRRDAGALQRPVDARDADALSRAPPGSAGTDLDYAARINGYADVPAFIAAHAGSPWFVSMVGFVAGLPFLYQMVERARQIEVPKYLRPRTDTPKLTVGHGGCFGCIYSVRGAGGYQMFGITPMPIYDPKQEVGYLKELMTFFRPGDIVKFKPVDREGYDEAVRDVDAAASTR